MAHAKLLLSGAALAALGLAVGAAAAQTASAPRFDASTLYGLSARNIGAAVMSGRVAAVAGRDEPGGKTTLLVGAASGGVWRSDNGGTTFRPIFDREPVQSIGAIALDPNRKETLWVGTGESWMRGSVSIGDGIYKSTDGGETWANMGLPNSEHISKIIVDPTNSNTVYACVPGKLWSDSADRGLYKTTDGGRTWALILKGPNLSTGCSTLTIDPKNPKKLFAGLWDFRRKGWTFRSGGESPEAPSGSALLVTQDGGASWTKLDAQSAPGLPKGPWGREAVSIAPSNPNIVYAFVESARSALFRSDDGGKTWKERDRSQSMVWRPFYFANLIVDPHNADRLFKTDYGLIVSEDGGQSFSEVGSSTHADHHAVWIDPANTQHMVTGNDGGLWISYDGGARWNKTDNLPISQFYHVSVDDKDPYQVYGGLQDNSAWVGDSAYPGGISNSRWENLGGGDGFWAWADPADPEGYAYVESQGGAIQRVDRKSLQSRDIQPKSDSKKKLRFNWNTPVALSPNEKGAIYIGAQYLFRSRDHGQSWDRISPDLTTNDKDQQKQEESGGVTVDNSAAEMHDTIYTISEAPKQPGVIWVGTDDGNLQLTRDGGKSWTNLTANVGLPPQSWVSWIEASHSTPGSALAAFDRHTFGDTTPYVYRTNDYGKTWTPLVRPGQGVRGFAHVIKEDPQTPGLLYLGTEFGLWISPDGGRRWAQFKGGEFPDVPVRDLAFQARDADLAIATHGRGIWIIDDLTPLRALTPQAMAQDLTFLASRPAQQRIEANGGWSTGDAQFVGDDPPDGAFITYFQPRRRLIGKLALQVLDPAGKVVDTLPASTRAGINRVVWPMRAPAPRVPPAAQLAGASSLGPRWLPGTYTARLTSNGHVLTQAFPVVLDRRATFSLADRRKQFDAAERVSDLFGRETDLLVRINAVREGAGARAAALPAADPLRARLLSLADKSDALRKEIVATKEGGAITGEERLREHTDQLYGAITGWEGQPADYQLKRIDVLQGELTEVSDHFTTLVQADLAPINASLAGQRLQPIAAPATPPIASQAAGGQALKTLAGWRFGLRSAAAAEQDAAERD